MKYLIPAFLLLSSCAAQQKKVEKPLITICPTTPPQYEVSVEQWKFWAGTTFFGAALGISIAYTGEVTMADKYNKKHNLSDEEKFRVNPGMYVPMLMFTSSSAIFMYIWEAID